MKSVWNIIIYPIIGLVLTGIMYLIYIHALSFLLFWKPVMIVFTILIGIAILLVIYNFLVNLKDFIVSIFKKDKGVDKDGFTKF